MADYRTARKTKEVNTGTDARASAATRPPTPTVRKPRTERPETPEYSHQHLDGLVADAKAALEVTGAPRAQAEAAARDQAAAAWAALSSALGSHLDKEEREALPLLAQRVTAAEWKPLEDYFIRTLGPSRLLAYIPWLSSAATAQERKQLLPTQPAAFRLIEALTRPWYARSRLRLGLPEPLPAPEMRP